MAFEIDDVILAAWQSHIDADDLDAAVVAQWGPVLTGAAPLPKDWTLPAVTTRDAKGVVVELEPARLKPASAVKPDAAMELTKKPPPKPAPDPKPKPVKQ